MCSVGHRSSVSISTLENVYFYSRKYNFFISLSTLEAWDQNFKFLFLLSKFEIRISNFSFYSRNSRSESQISLSTLEIRDQNFKFLFLLSKFEIRILNFSFYSRIYFFWLSSMPGGWNKYKTCFGCPEWSYAIPEWQKITEKCTLFCGLLLRKGTRKGTCQKTRVFYGLLTIRGALPAWL